MDGVTSKTWSEAAHLKRGTPYISAPLICKGSKWDQLLVYDKDTRGNSTATTAIVINFSACPLLLHKPCKHMNPLALDFSHSSIPQQSSLPSHPYVPPSWATYSNARDSQNGQLPTNALVYISMGGRGGTTDWLWDVSWCCRKWGDPLL